MLAEMYRELGNHKEAKLQLNKISIAGRTSAYNQIENMNYKKKSNLIKII